MEPEDDEEEEYSAYRGGGAGRNKKKKKKKPSGADFLDLEEFDSDEEEEGDNVMALRSVTRKLGSKLLPRFSPASSLLHSHATSFGFKEVREEEKSQMVGNVFSNVASNYDTMNDLMSAGLHRLWKDRLVSKLNPFPGMNHLDVAGRTGDVAFRILDSINSIKRRALLSVLEEETKVYVCDINPNMLNVSKKRALQRVISKGKMAVEKSGIYS